MLFFPIKSVVNAVFSLNNPLTGEELKCKVIRGHLISITRRASVKCEKEDEEWKSREDAILEEILWNKGLKESKIIIDIKLLSF